MDSIGALSPDEVGMMWVVKAWQSEDVALYGKVVSPPCPNSQ